MGKRIVERAVTVVRFMAAGLPAFAMALPLNWVLVEHAKFPHAAAYAVVLLFQVSVNYLMCKAFVFRVPGRRVTWAEFRRFASGILGFRLLDWGVYLFLIKVFGVYYLLAQILNVAVFAVLKFLFTERILTGAWGGATGTRPAE